MEEVVGRMQTVPTRQDPDRQTDRQTAVSHPPAQPGLGLGLGLGGSRPRPACLVRGASDPDPATDASTAGVSLVVRHRIVCPTSLSPPHGPWWQPVYPQTDIRLRCPACVRPFGFQVSGPPGVLVPGGRVGGSVGLAGRQLRAPINRSIIHHSHIGPLLLAATRSGLRIDRHDATHPVVRTIPVDTHCGEPRESAPLPAGSQTGPLGVREIAVAVAVVVVVVVVGSSLLATGLWTDPGPHVIGCQSSIIDILHHPSGTRRDSVALHGDPDW